VIIGVLDVKIYEKLVYGVHWSVELQLQKVGQWGPPAWQWHLIGEWGGPIGQRGNWWMEGNSTLMQIIRQSCLDMCISTIWIANLQGNPVVDLSTPEPEQLVPALSVSARALAMSRCRPPGLQLLTPDLRRCLLNQRPHPRRNLITVGMAYHCLTHPERPYRQKWYYVGRTLLLKAVMAGFARFWGLEVESLYFWLYGHAIKPDETVSNVCYIYSLFILMLLISLCSLA
jgi:hypothetical protein